MRSFAWVLMWTLCAASFLVLQACGSDFQVPPIDELKEAWSPKDVEQLSVSPSIYVVRDFLEEEEVDALVDNVRAYLSQRGDSAWDSETYAAMNFAEARIDVGLNERMNQRMLKLTGLTAHHVEGMGFVNVYTKGFVLDSLHIDNRGRRFDANPRMVGFTIYLTSGQTVFPLAQPKGARDTALPRFDDIFQTDDRRCTPSELKPGHPCEPLISRANKDCERASGTAFHVNGGDALMFDHLDLHGNVTVAAIHAGCDLTEAYDHSGRSVPVKITLAKQLLRSPSVSCGKGRASHCSQCDPKMCGGDCSKGDGKCIRAKSTADEL